MIREELSRLATWEERHRRLLARLLLVLLVTALIDALGTVSMYFLERHAAHTEISSLGDALFFTTVQLLTVSSQIKNPLTPAGRMVDVFLEIWALFVVTAIAAPAAARQVPTAPANSKRGIRMSSRMARSSPVSAQSDLPVSAQSVPAIGNLTIVG